MQVLRHAAVAVVLPVVAMGLLAGCSGPPAVGAPEPADSALVMTAARSVRQLDTGRYSIEVSMGLDAPGQRVVRTTMNGGFDRERGASEVSVDLAPLVDSLSVNAGFVAPAELGDELRIRVVDGGVYVHAEDAEANWVLMAVEPEDAAEAFGIYQPEQFADLLEHVGTAVTRTTGGMIDGVQTVRYQGWIDAVAMERLRGGDASRLAVVVAAAPPGLADRMVRFDLWVGDDGVPRRLVIELDADTVASVDGGTPEARERAGRVVMRIAIEWFAIGAPIEIEAPPPHQVTDPLRRI